jgi:hypothetical protein
MHDRTDRGIRAPSRGRPRLAGLVGALVLTLAVAACAGGGNDPSDGVASLGGSDTPTSTTRPGGGDLKQAALAYARCMREHGIDMPDPKFDGNERVAQQLPAGVGPDDPKFKAAHQACKQHLPGGGEPQKVDPQVQRQMLAFARCMREHGVNIPDPKPGGGIEIGPEAGVSPDDPKFKAAQRACQQYEPKGGQKHTQSNGGGT